MSDIRLTTKYKTVSGNTQPWVSFSPQSARPLFHPFNLKETLRHRKSTCRVFVSTREARGPSDSSMKTPADAKLKDELPP